MKLINSRNRQICSNDRSGFSLIELLVAVAIVSIIAAFAYPAYTQFVVKAKRMAGKSMLLRVADRQQQYFMDNKTYANSLTLLGFPTDPFMIAEDGAIVAGGDDDRVYMISLVAPTSTTFTASALPQMLMASEDTYCATLSLSNTGQKSSSGGGDRCW